MAQSQEALAFDQFRLVPSERLLTKDGILVDLGARALDVLICLLSQPNEIFTKQAITDWVWPDTMVSEGSLRFQIAGLRKALGDGQDGARYIATLAGRGYCFVAPIERIPSTSTIDSSMTAVVGRNIPLRITRVIGRSADISHVASLLESTRLVTIVGVGGVGKTTVAIAVAHGLQEDSYGAMLFVDLGLISDPRMVAGALTAMLGISSISNDQISALVVFLRDKRMLLILDNCEHMIDAVSSMVSSILAAAPDVRILATSREALRAAGERVYRLPSLSTPSTHHAITAQTAMTYSSVQLFVERVSENGIALELNDADAVILAKICERLDGLALAIELAAARFESYGLRKTADLLNERLSLSWQWRRSVAPRQRTLEATLDWSYDLLSAMEQDVLWRLSIFVGNFTLEEALAIIPDVRCDKDDVLLAIDGLVSKSMISNNPTGALIYYRLLETTRSYLHALDTYDSALSSRHATYYRDWLINVGAEWPTVSTRLDRSTYFGNIHNVRAALKWCYGRNGDTQLGTSLAAAAVPVFFAMSLLEECRQWAHRAINSMDAETRGSRVEMRLQLALSLSQVWRVDDNYSAFSAVTRSLSIAETHSDKIIQVHLLSILHVWNIRIGEFFAARKYSRLLEALIPELIHPPAIALAHIMSGFGAHFGGDLSQARHALELVLLPYTPARSRTESSVAIPPPQDDAMFVTTLAMASTVGVSALARTLWMEGHPSVAIAYVDQIISNATVTENPVTLMVTLIYAIPVILWNGDWEHAEEQCNRLIQLADTHSLRTHRLIGDCFRGQIMVARGLSQPGIDLLEYGISELRSLHYVPILSGLCISLAQGLAATSRYKEALDLLDHRIGCVESKGDLHVMPELLRVKASILCDHIDRNVDSAEVCLHNALLISRSQGAKAWELRAAIDLAGILSDTGRDASARNLLVDILNYFSPGINNLDLAAARTLLARLGIEG